MLRRYGVDFVFLPKAFDAIPLPAAFGQPLRFVARIACNPYQPRDLSNEN
jgi:hypothetical protein